MSFRSWFSKGRNESIPSSPRLNGLVTSLVRYIESAEVGAETELRPAMIAKALGESELAILAAFYVLEKKGVVCPHYGVYCRNSNVPIEIYDSLDDVPAKLRCDVCAKQHSLDLGSMYIELFFTVDKHSLPLRGANAA